MPLARPTASALLTFAAASWCAQSLLAQTTAPAPAFEVASIKPYVYRGTGRAIARTQAAASKFEISGTRVSITGNLMSLVGGAYALERVQVKQSPTWTEDWATSEIYEIEARAPGDAPPTVAQARLMMQALLADRFQLKVNHQTSVAPVYYLELAPGGSKLSLTIFGDSPPNIRDRGSAGLRIRQRFLNYSVADFINQVIWRQFDRPLIDKTGLSGAFDFSLEYIAERPGVPAAVAEAMGITGDPEPGLPLVPALRDQLGLRVVPANGPVETVVILHAERPSAN
jgi:uncharacterized protein (TIGR03435 family)